MKRRQGEKASKSPSGAESPYGADVTASIFPLDLSPNAVVGERIGFAKVYRSGKVSDFARLRSDIFPFGKARPDRPKIPSVPAVRFDGIFFRRRSGAFKDRQNDRQMVWLWRNPTSGESSFAKSFRHLENRITD